MSTRHVALVTGAARGIGLATAQGFAAQGWRVVLLDRDADELARVVSDLPDATALVCDIFRPRCRGCQLCHAGPVGLPCEQCWRCAIRPHRGVRFRPVAHHHGHQSGRHLPVFAGGLAVPEGQPGQHRECRLHLGPARLDPAGGLWHVQKPLLFSLPSSKRQNWANMVSARIASAPDRCAPSWRWQSTAKRLSTLIMMRSRSTATGQKPKSRPRSSSLPRIAPATLPGRFWPQMAVLTARAWACPRYARARHNPCPPWRSARR